jgi:hypothetical protein
MEETDVSYHHIAQIPEASIAAANVFQERWEDGRLPPNAYPLVGYRRPILAGKLSWL